MKNRGGTDPVTTIDLLLPSSEKVTADVHDLFGRQAAELINKRLSAGRHRLKWNTRTLASGCYFIRIQTDSGLYGAPIFLSQ